MVAIGHHTAAYIRRHTGREAAVIHPPIYTDKYTAEDWKNLPETVQNVIASAL